MVIEIIGIHHGHLVFVNFNNLGGVKMYPCIITVPYKGALNVKDMLAESSAKEPKAVVADRIPKLPKNPHWTVKAVEKSYPTVRNKIELMIEFQTSQYLFS